MRKEKILSDLYHGKLNPMAKELVHDSDYEKYLQEVCRLEDELANQLDEKDKELLEDFIS